MTEINEAGYEAIRQLINSDLADPPQWDYIALLDELGDEVTRVQISTDARAQWTTIETDQVQAVEFEVEGADSDITLPVTIEGSALFDTDSGGERLSEVQQDSFTLEVDGDSYSATHEVEVPELVE